MTRFLPLTRGGWPAEVLCEVTVGTEPLCVKHRLLNGDVAVEMHLLDGRYSRDHESAYDLIPAPEPSEEALRAVVEALRILRAEPTCDPEDAFKAGLCAAYAIDGVTPQQQPDRVAELEAEVAKLRAEVDRYRNWTPSKAALDAARRVRWTSALQPTLAAFRHDFPDAQPGTGEQA